MSTPELSQFEKDIGDADKSDPNASTVDNMETFFYYLWYYNLLLYIGWISILAYTVLNAFREGWSDGVREATFWMIFFGMGWALLKAKSLVSQVLEEHLESSSTLRMKLEGWGVPERILTESAPFTGLTVVVCSASYDGSDYVKLGLRWAEMKCMREFSGVG